MKMETTLYAEVAGKVAEVAVRPGNAGGRRGFADPARIVFLASRER